MNILGISAYYHDAAAALLQSGTLRVAAQEERFTRVKHDASFPVNAVRWCLEERGLTIDDIDYVVFYDKPLLKFERLLETYLSFAPKGFRSLAQAMPVWLKEKLFLKKLLKDELKALRSDQSSRLPTLLFTTHHQSHAASAFYPSPFERAAVLCLDGVGEWATTSAWLGEGHTLSPLWEMRFPHSLGLLYSAFTYFTGFKVNSGEYKLMGLAPYGEPRYTQTILDELLDLKPDGSFRLNMRYFDFATGLKMTNHRFAELFDGPARAPESAITQREMDLARSIQAVTEEVVLRLCRAIHEETGADALCLAGGVALNCVANGRIHRESPFKQLWIQPAAGDAGGAVGAAFAAWHDYLEKPRSVEPGPDAMNGAYLGPRYHSDDIECFLNERNIPYRCYSDSSLYDKVAERLANDEVVGWFQGAMEFGPRALGNRSILGNPQSSAMQSTMNLKIKFRESFRPFAPAVKYDKASEWFAHEGDSPYMLLVADVHPSKQKSVSSTAEGLDKLYAERSTIPAVTHVDGSARLQTVHPDVNPRFYALMDAFEAKTGCPVLINTSFNVRGEPIVMTPEDAYRCFMRTNMDTLVLGNCVLTKANQPEFQDTENWKETFVLD